MIKRNIDEPAPGQYFWRVIESDARGQQQLILRTADESATSYELALASGQLALKSAMRKEAERAQKIAQVSIRHFASWNRLLCGQRDPQL